MEKNLFYATMMENGKLVIRQCKFLRLVVRPNNIKFNVMDGSAISVNHNFIDFEIAYAGVNFTSKSLYDLRQRDIKVCQTYEAAKNNDSSGLMVYSYDCAPLIKLDSFNLHYFDVIKHFSGVAQVKAINYTAITTYFKPQFISYYWNGTRAVETTIQFRFTFDVLNLQGNTCAPNSCDTEISLCKLYNSAEECKNDNAIKVYAFP